MAVLMWLAHPRVESVLRGSAIGLAVIVSADLLRFKVPAFERTYERYLGYFMVRLLRETL